MNTELPLAVSCDALVLLLEEMPLPQEDWLVEPQRLIAPEGKGLQKKRSQLRRFECEVAEWRVVPLDAGCLDEAYSVERQWQQQPNDPEQAYLRRCFQRFEKMGLCGVLLYAFDRPVGYAIAADCGFGGGYILAARALENPPGSRAMLHRQLALLMQKQIPELRWINLGWIGGAQERQNRLSYNPISPNSIE